MRLAAEFFCSAPAFADCPGWNRIEVALCGRSNVGKSSLLNALAGRKNLARISKTPGRTRSLNFFTVEHELALVDLPGYGYARISQTEAAEIGRRTKQYLRMRDRLRGLILLVDARRGPQPEDVAMAQLAERPATKLQPLELIVVATKCDKLKRHERRIALERFQETGWLPRMCSSLTGEGMDELRRLIRSVARKHQMAELPGAFRREKLEEHHGEPDQDD